MQKKARILIDQAHQQAWAVKPEVSLRMNPANPADASYAKMAELAQTNGFEVDLHESGYLAATNLENADILLIPHASSPEWEQTTGVGSPIFTDTEIQAIENFVANGGALLLLAETEQPKYGNNFAQLALKFGITIENATVQDPENCYKDVPTWVHPRFERLTESDFGYRVEKVTLYRAGTLVVRPDSQAEVFMCSSEHALPESAALAVAVKHHKGRVVVMTDSDIFGDDSLADCDNAQLLLNIVSWLSNAKAALLAGQKKGSQLDSH